MNPMSKINLRSGQFKGHLVYYTSSEDMMPFGSRSTIMVYTIEK